LIKLRPQNAHERQMGKEKGIHHATKALTVVDSSEELPINWELLNEKIKRDKKGFDAMVAFLRNRKDMCRNAMILSYFELSKASEHSKFVCGNCDVCRRNNVESIPF